MVAYGLRGSVPVVNVPNTIRFLLPHVMDQFTSSFSVRLVKELCER